MQNDEPKLTLLSDDELVDLAVSGENSAFAVLIDRHTPSLMKLACSILHNESDAEDELQNACWKAFEHLGQFQREAKFSTWLTRILVNQCLMRLRQQKRAKLVAMDSQPVEDMPAVEIIDSAYSPEEALGRIEVADLVRREIKRIPPLLRNVFVLRDVEQLPIDTVAERLGISVPAAKSRLLRARQELRTRLGKHCGNIGPATLMV